MRIAFVGKGGSGKSTVSAEFCKAALRAGQKVLAIDLDYNMDLSYNLGLQEGREDRFISRSRPDFYRYTALGEKEALKQLVDRLDQVPRFNPDLATDWYSQRYAINLENDLKLMVVGPLPENRLYGKECGHVYMSPIRYFLPLLETDRCVVLDSTAGTDLVSFGMYQGVDAIVCVVEPRINSIRVFEQIQPIAREFDIPLYIFVNKAEDDQMDWLGDKQSSLVGTLPVCTIYKDRSDNSLINARFDDLYHTLQALPFDPIKRQQRIRHWKKIHDTLEVA